MGCKNVLIKSGNSFEKYSTDILYDGKEFYYFETPKLIQKIHTVQDVHFHLQLQQI